MKELPKLVITATTANSWLYPDLKNWAQTTDDLVESAVKCAEAGASILHIHLPPNEEADVVNRVRERTDAIIQCGMSSFPIEERDFHFKCHPDMLSIIANHHDEHFPSGNVMRLHSLEEFEAYCNKCREYHIKPEFEIWHMGSYWNLKWMINQGLLNPPYVCTLFFNWPGGNSSPATPDELLHRVKYIPEKFCLDCESYGCRANKIGYFQLFPWVVILESGRKIGLLSKMEFPRKIMLN